MFGYSMVQMVRSYADKLDKPLRNEILNLYKPFAKTPCFLHTKFENFLRSTKKLPIIVEFERDGYEDELQLLGNVVSKHSRNTVRHHFSRIHCCSAEVTPNGLTELLSDCGRIRRIYLNRKVRALLDAAVPSANARNVVRKGTVLTGKGVTVAVVDTGIYPHPDLEGRITSFVDFVNNRTEPYDDNGHGTHCAGDVAGNGLRSSGKYAGPAPEASLFGVKVLNKMGSGSLETIIQGVDWCIQHNEDVPEDPIHIISMSLGSTPQPYASENDDPMVKIVEEAWAAGITVCVAAGNEGPDSGTIASPGISSEVITVGALDDNNTDTTRDDDTVASFSSRGPTPYGVVKPDVLAPGVNIVSLRSPNSYLDKLQKSNRVDGDYFTLSGTSMATPICAGVAALMKQANPGAMPDQIKQMLISGADLWTDRDPNVYGAGYINAERSIPS
ncbi:S8 family peptidase [Paenibacillus caui]|uniref:S8 family peptidase n=1 Tax=Paenibacillus caui TaxID=2873927 RepID=UPI001CA8ED54